MFWPDVIDLKQFYATLLGQMTASAIRNRIRNWWPEANGDTMLGIGFATPYLLHYLKNATVGAFMPAQQGIIHWPITQDNLTVLVDETELPIADNHINRALIIHALENTEHARQMLQEVWRILSPSGRIIIVAPNRKGIWARASTSPFAHGQPFSAGQLKDLLKEERFTPLQTTSALFFPPTQRRFLLKSSGLIEKIGRRFFSGFGGLILIEAEKQLYAPIKGKREPVRKRAYRPAAQPALGKNTPSF